MHRNLSLAALAPALAIVLAGCTHIGTNVAGNFSCRAPKSGCEPLSAVDAKAVRELVKAEGAHLKELRQRIGLVAADNARTGERTLRIVFPAHVDTLGTLHEEAVAWTVVEAARWAGELRRGETAEPKGTMRALRQALKDQARRTGEAVQNDEAIQKADAHPNLQPLVSGTGAFGEDSVPVDIASLFIPSSPLALPSPGGEAKADVPPSAAEGSDMSPTPHVRAPRPLEDGQRIWPSAAAIEAAKAQASAAPKKEPK